MRSTRLLECFGCAAAALFFCSVVHGQADSLFAKANDEYTRNNFSEAIRDYENLVRSGEWSAPLFYNLGNAYFRNGDFAHAILNYERALALEPRHPETTANLAIARDEARALELRKTRPELLLRFANVNQITIIAAAA